MKGDVTHLRAAPGVEVAICGYRPSKGLLPVSATARKATCATCRQRGAGTFQRLQNNMRGAWNQQRANAYRGET